jgi:hypothetical protein
VAAVMPEDMRRGWIKQRRTFPSSGPAGHLLPRGGRRVLSPGLIRGVGADLDSMDGVVVRSYSFGLALHLLQFFAFGFFHELEHEEGG